MFSTIGDHFNLLCIGLRCAPADLHRLVTDEGWCRKRREIRRRPGSLKPREVWEIEDPLRRAQRQIALWLRPLANAQPTRVTAFRSNASIQDNAAQHIKQDFILVADLEDFYGSISLTQVRSLFMSHGMHAQIALTLARLCCVKERLIQGGRASPYIANLIGESVDRAIVSLVPNCTYTRYVDDLTLSGKREQLPTQQDLEQAIAPTRFHLRPNSYRIVERQTGAFVTGLNIAGTRPKLSRAQRRQMERFLHYAETFGYTSAARETFKAGRRTGKRDRGDIINYVKGFAYWARSIDQSLGDYWLQRISVLNP